MDKKPPERVHNSKMLLQRRRYLRNNPTPEEALLWQQLKGLSLGCKFRRQHSVTGYILDFYCPSKKLAIELDGAQHDFAKGYDKARDHLLHGFGIKVLRFKNELIRNDIEKVIEIIKENLE
jgi:very-short-patch-repair endonuclease